MAGPVGKLNPEYNTAHGSSTARCFRRRRAYPRVERERATRVAETGPGRLAAAFFPCPCLRPDPHLPGKVTPALSAYRSTLHTQYATCRERFARRDPAPCMRVVRGEKVRRACSSFHHERLASDLQRSLRDVLCPCNNNNCTNT